MLEILGCTVGGVDFSEQLMLPSIINLVVTLIKIFIPIVLVIFGMIDLAKAVMSNDEKEMKGAQTKLIKRVIYAILVFLIVSIVQLVFGVLSSTGASDDSIAGCIACFTSGTNNC